MAVSDEAVRVSAHGKSAPLVVVEFAGLPGAGKSTICSHLTVPHRTKASTPLRRWRLRRSVLAVAWQLLGLSLTTRPFKWSRFVRSFNIIVLLRCYAPVDLPVVLDHGLLHKIWSLLMDADSFPEERLQRLIEDIRPYAANYIIWVDAPLETAALRVSQRTHGRSRFDGLPLRDINTRLASKSQLLTRLVDSYRQHTGAGLLRLDGMLPAMANAQRIDVLLSGGVVEEGAWRRNTAVRLT
jgi:hypothetical protein